MHHVGERTPLGEPSTYKRESPMKEGLSSFLQAVLACLIVQAIVFAIAAWAITGSPLQAINDAWLRFVNAETAHQALTIVIWTLFTLLLSLAVREKEGGSHLHFHIRM